MNFYYLLEISLKLKKKKFSLIQKSLKSNVVYERTQK
jgi:hypothetical protein